MVQVDTGEAVLSAIANRRSMKLVKPETPPRRLIERILEAATHAPNHHKTEPWRFVVVTGDARRELGDVMADAARERLKRLDEEHRRGLIEKERAKPLRAPVLIAVAAVPSSEPKVVEIEEIESTAAAVENMLLAAEAVGLGAMWRTGDAAYDPNVKRFLELPDHAHIVAFVYVGYPEALEVPERRRSVESYSIWRGWETV